jgi:secreted trypsin-like serine protease
MFSSMDKSARARFTASGIRRCALCVLLTIASAIHAGAQESADAQAGLSARVTAPRNLYPFSLRLAPQGMGVRQFFCNAVLIRPNWAVTSAHCVAGARGFSVYFGNAEEKDRAISVQNVIVHEGFDRKTGFQNDIALLQLSSPAAEPTIDVAEPATIDGGKMYEADAAGRFVVAGWGALTEGESAVKDFSSGVQRHLNVALITREVCNGPHLYEGKVAVGQFCAASGISGVDACSGFSGAPLMVPNRRGKLELAGLVSWGMGCARVGKPTVYTDVAHFAEWINATTLKADSTRYQVKNQLPEVLGPQGVTDPLRLASRIVERDKTPGMVPIGLFRFAVSLGAAGQNQALGHFCGGILLNRQWVLTAAHCVYAARDTPDQIQIKVDSDLLSRGGVYLKAQSIHIYPDFHTTPFGNHVHDIALIAVTGDVPTDIYVPPLLTPDAETRFVPAKGEAIVVGWGKDAFSPYGRISEYLHMATIPIVSNEQCNNAEHYKGLVDKNMMCAGGNGPDACQGDSGGALLVLDERTEFLIAGLVSWGEGCGNTPNPGVYVRVSSYLEWIQSRIDGLF